MIRKHYQISSFRLTSFGIEISGPRLVLEMPLIHISVFIDDMILRGMGWARHKKAFRKLQVSLLLHLNVSAHSLQNLPLAWPHSWYWYESLCSRSLWIQITRLSNDRYHVNLCLNAAAIIGTRCPKRFSFQRATQITYIGPKFFRQLSVIIHLRISRGSSSTVASDAMDQNLSLTESPFRL